MNEGASVIFKSLHIYLLECEELFSAISFMPFKCYKIKELKNVYYKKNDSNSNYDKNYMNI